MEELTPQQIVNELNRYIVGQGNAKKSVAIALRNRYRRRRLPPEMQDEIMPKNIIMIGPTGVGKTEIARRLAKLVNAPFVKVEATKFTEVGYVGRDVESMIRDLVEVAIRMVKNEKMTTVEARAVSLTEMCILGLLVPLQKRKKPQGNPLEMLFGDSEDNLEPEAEPVPEPNLAVQHRQELLVRLRNGELDDRYVELDVEEKASPMLEVFSGSGMEEMGVNFQDLLGNIMPKKKKKRQVPIREARRIIMQEEAQKLIDMDEVVALAIERAEQMGIIFLDEIDKIAGRDNSYGPDVSRGGVQRDILPIIEGSTVVTKYGTLKTDYILFIAAGAFHVSKPSDLIPELQGRFPIRVELQSLTQNDFLRILTEPDNSLIRQYTALLATEGIEIKFTDEALLEIADVAFRVNEQNENIGARRLHTIMEKVLEDLSFRASEITEQEIVIDRAYVADKLTDIVGNEDLSRYIL
jgi:ATP-dependent HslUV protease ATP-binding subunit HslU